MRDPGRAAALFVLVLCAQGCRLGPGIDCVDDTPCAPWGQCGADGYCLTSEGGGGDAGGGEGTAVGASLAFGAGGLVPCGSQAAALAVQVHNDSSEPLTLRYALSKSPSFYRVMGPATVEPGATASVVVTPGRLPPSADTSPDFFFETLTVQATGTSGATTYPVALHLTAQGARLAFTPSSLTLEAKFPGSDVKTLMVVNTGNLGASYALVLTGNNRFAVTGSTTVAAGAQTEGAVTFTPGRPGEKKQSGTVNLTSSSPLCAPLPKGVALTGN